MGRLVRRVRQELATLGRLDRREIQVRQALQAKQDQRGLQAQDQRGLQGLQEKQVRPDLLETPDLQGLQAIRDPQDH
mgnify:CR=1 FL=1